MVHQSLRAARDLEAGGIGTVVANVHTIKPLDEKEIVKLVSACGAAVVAEEHQQAGGLGGAIAEVLARQRPTPLEFVGLPDTFGESGAPADLIERYGMGVAHVTEAVRRIIKRAR